MITTTNPSARTGEAQEEAVVARLTTADSVGAATGCVVGVTLP